jgi:hypothetical protein
MNPAEQAFINLFGDTSDALESDGPEVVLRAAAIKVMKDGRIIVALGSKVSRLLYRHDVSHRRMIHPAARGRIRAKAVYIEHVRTTLCDTGNMGN